MSTPQKPAEGTTKSIFADIISAPVMEPLEKYANMYMGINANELASIDQGKSFIPYVDKLTGLNPPSPSLIAIPSGMQTVEAHGVPVEQMLADGFPSDKKIHLFMVFEGPKKEEEDQYAGDDACINLALGVRKYFGVPPGIPANPEGLLSDIRG